jgi:hypothetical protein
MKKRVIEEIDSISTAEEWLFYMKDILENVYKIENTPACYDPKPYLKLIKKAVKVGKIAISKYENV